MNIINYNPKVAVLSTEEDDRVYIEFGDQEIELSIGHNDIGLHIDVFSEKEAEGIPVREYQIHFEDIHEEAKKNIYEIHNQNW